MTEITETTEKVQAPQDGGKVEAKAEYMRAKWARERGERSVERLAKDVAGKSGDAKIAASNSLKEAKSVLQGRITAEKKAKAAYEKAKTPAK